MKKKFSNMDDLCDVIDFHNRLLLRDKKEKIKLFHTMCEMYVFFLEQLREEYKNGFIEPGYLVMERYGLNQYETEDWVNSCGRKFNLPRVIMIKWTNLELADYSFLRRLTESVHSLLGTEFDLESFTTAYNQVKQKFLKNYED